MGKEYLVTAYEIIRTVYVIKADSSEEAKAKLKANDHSYDIALEEYHDRDSIDDEVEENV